MVAYAVDDGREEMRKTSFWIRHFLWSLDGVVSGLFFDILKIVVAVFENANIDSLVNEL